MADRDHQNKDSASTDSGVDGTLPPPPTPAVHDQRRAIRIAGIMLACSTPISGFVAYALVAILVGERHLEGPDGLTGMGWAVVGLPLLLGASLVLWSVWASNIPSRRTVGAVVAFGAAALLAVGLWSVGFADGDASIGGGILILVSLPLAAVALVLVRRGGARP